MNELELAIRQCILASGPITFAEFMDAALYSPLGGYYTRVGASARSAQSGDPADYFTSPMAHPAFGALIAVQLRDMWRRMARSSEFTVVELGAGDGLLARDVTAYAERLDPAFADALEYLAVDRVPRQNPLFPVHGPDRIPSSINGCLLSNELLDAMPVHRFVIEKGELRELYVGVEGDRFCEVIGLPSTPAIAARLGELAHGLPDGYRGEVNLGIDSWWADLVSNTLDAGYVMTVDYGYDRAELYAPARWRGTLRCYYRHTRVDEPLARVGHQDMTAHVDFTSVDEALVQRGFDIAGHATQEKFLTRLGAAGFVEALRKSGMSPFEQAANRAGILELLNPRGMGGFRVAIHARNAPKDRLIGLSEPDDRDTDMSLPLPTLDARGGHASLLASRYPDAARMAGITWEGTYE